MFVLLKRSASGYGKKRLLHSKIVNDGTGPGVNVLLNLLVSSNFIPVKYNSIHLFLYISNNKSACVFAPE